MKTLGEIISLRQNKYNEDRKNPSISDFYQGRFDGWYSAYRDLKEILEQNGFNLDVPVIGAGKTNADHIRSMTDEELADFLDSVYCHGWSKGANGFSDDDPYYHDWIKQPYGGDT